MKNDIELKNKAINELRLILKEQSDLELDHIYADNVLCDLLNDLGFSEVIEEWKKIEKWYS